MSDARKAVTRRKLSPSESLFHLVMTVMTGGAWGFVWWSRVHSRTSVTRYRR